MMRETTYDEFVGVLVTLEQKRSLQRLADARGCTISNIVRAAIDDAVKLPGDTGDCGPLERVNSYAAPREMATVARERETR